MIRKKTRRLVALSLAFLMLILALGLVGCNSGTISQKPGEQTIVTRLCYEVNGPRPTEGIHSAMQGGKGSKNNKVPVYITTTEDGKQYVKMSFDGYTNIDYDENIFPGRGPGGSDLDVSKTATTVIEPFEVRGEIDGEIEPLEIKTHYTLHTATKGVVIDQDILLQGTGHFKWQKAVDTLELHIYWKYFLKAPETGNYLGGLDGDVEAHHYYVFDLPETVSNQEGLLTSSKIASRADKDTGETGVTIPEALAIILIGGGAALAGAGAGGNGGGGGSGGDDGGKKGKRSRYQMRLKKEFGDAIRYNTQPVTVYARIVELTPEGEEIDRADLSAALEMFSGGGLKVGSTAMAGNYMGALVCAEAVSGGENPDRGVLSIRFSGEGGSFQNDVSFRLVGDAYIHFPERGKELTPTTYMIYGDNGDYELPLELRDFILPPQKVRLELPGDQPFTAEAERVDDTHYVIRLHNTSQMQTDKIQPQQMIMVTIYAENEKESAHDSFLVNLLPEGLSLRPFTGCPLDENGRLLVACSLTPEQGEEETEIEQTHFQLVLAVSQTEKNGRKRVVLIEPNRMSCNFEPLTAQSEKLQNLLKSFPYEIDFSEAKSAGIFRIHPQRQLPQDDRLDYDVTLPVSCAYDNQTYTLDIPLRLLGDKLLPMAEKSEEISLLIKRIKKYVDEEDRARLIRGFKNDLPKMSAADVRLLSKSLVYASQAEVYKANRHLLDAQMLDWVCWGLEWYKWIGDQAISVIISKLSYNYAPFVEAVVMPAKDLLVEHMGIWLSDYVSGAPSPGTALDFEQLESTGLTMIENMLTNLIDGKTEPKKAAQILSLYLVLRTANYYFYEKNDDGSPLGIYGAIAAAFGDLTAQSFKIILGTKLEQLANNPATTKMFGGYADEFIKGLFPAEFYNNGGKWEFDLIKKYIEEITVLASAKVYAGIQAGAEQDAVAGEIIVTLIEDLENPEKTVKIGVNPLDLGKEFFDYIFDKIFGTLTFTDSVVESPEDPPCMLA